MDGLSAASSVIAVVSFAMQLAESVKKLYDFWESVEDAPQSISSTVDELKLLSDILAGYADMECVHSLSSNMKLALESCATQIQVLNAITDKFEDYSKSSSRARRKWAALKVVLKAEKIKEFQEALSRAKTSLILANQHYTMTMISADLEDWRSWRTALMSEINTKSQTPFAVSGSWNTSKIEEFNDRDAESLEDSYLSPRTGKKSTHLEFSSRKRFKVSSSRSCLSSIFGDLSLISQTFSTTPTRSTGYLEGYEEEEYATESLFIIRPALWLVYLGIKCELRVELSQSPGKWTQTLNTFRPVADDSLIFEFCKSGNIDGVKLLLRKGDASIWDTDSKGRTPLHVAASYIEPGICKLLLDAGADSEARDYYNHSCFNLACNDQMKTSYEWTVVSMNHIRKIDVLRLFLHQTDLTDPENLRSEDWESLKNLAKREHAVPGTYKSTPSAFAWIVRNLKNEIRENIQSNLLSRLIFFIADVWSISDIRPLIADISTPRCVQIGECTPLHIYIWLRDFDSVRSLVQQGVYLHYAQHDRRWSTIPESPTSIALYSSKSFADWRKVLLEENISFDEFVTQELQHGSTLKTQGWTEHTLLKLFRLDYKSETYPETTCECCGLTRVISMVETSWQQVLKRIRDGQDACYPSRCRIPSTGNSITKLSNIREVAEPRPQISRVVQEENTPETIHYLHQNSKDSKPFHSLKFEDWLVEYRFHWKWLCHDCWEGVSYKVLNVFNLKDYVIDDDESDNDGEDTSNEDSPLLFSINL